MKINQVVASVEAEASGPSYSVPRLSQAIAACGHAVTLLSLGPPGTIQTGTYRHVRFTQDFASPRLLAKPALSREMRRALIGSDADVHHTHGLWTMPNVYPAEAVRRRRRPFLLSPRGMLGADALKFSRTVKKLFWTLLQERAARQVSCFHATGEQEYEEVRAFGLTQPVAVIPNGIDLPAADDHVRSGAPYVVSLGRIHPKKGLDRLIMAWAEVERDFPGWLLRIVGPSEVGYAAQLESLAAKLRLASVKISGPVFGEEKFQLLQEAEIFALSTLNENFGMTVAESLAVRTPVISTKGAPWQGLEANECGWWIEHGVEPMAAALRSAMSLPQGERRAMGARGRAWMEREFGWAGIARQMVDVYQWQLEGGEPPACVRVG